MTALWAVCLPLDQVVWVQAQTVEIVLCSWARHFTPSASLCPGV